MFRFVKVSKRKLMGSISRILQVLTFILFIALLPFTRSIAQDSTATSTVPEKEESHSDFADRLFFGGNIGLQFGTYTYVDVSPLVGYKVTEKFHTGIGATYIYYSVSGGGYDYSTNIYGGRVF